MQGGPTFSLSRIAVPVSMLGIIIIPAVTMVSIYISDRSNMILAIALLQRSIEEQAKTNIRLDERDTDMANQIKQIEQQMAQLTDKFTAEVAQLRQDIRVGQIVNEQILKTMEALRADYRKVQKLDP